MNIETITMDKDVALEKLKLYKESLKKSARSKAETHITKEYKTAITALKELGKGHAILDIDDVISNAPIDSKERPRLAICRADLKQVRFTWEVNSITGIFTGQVEGSFWRSAKDIRLEVNMSRQHHYTAVRNWDRAAGLQPDTLNGYSLVPLVPPTVEVKNKLDSYHILWEVENWSDTEIGAKPNRDPYLLKRLNTTLFAVIAEWDLTELEMLVMKRRIDR